MEVSGQLMSRPLYSRGETASTQWMRVDGPQSWPAGGGEEKKMNFMTLWGIEPQSLNPQPSKYLMLL
jgi:hypothetical protein